MVSSHGQLTKVGAMVPKPDADRLTRLAQRNYRSIATEVRLAIAQHLKTNDPEGEQPA